VNYVQLDPEDFYAAMLAASPVVPAPEGEVVAWRYRAKNRPHDNWRLADYDMAADWPNLVAEPLYASPVVPVGREEVLAELTGGKCRTCNVLCGGVTMCNCARPEWTERTDEDKADAIIAALRPTGTWREA
jgi:hypothetical protein